VISERAYAKINLTLDVFAKRPDAYHEVSMIMQSIELSDLIWLDSTSSPGIQLDASVSHIPLDDRNLAVVAARRFCDFSRITPGLMIRIEKHIPVAAGLGGGSADAAAVLRGLNRLFNTQLSVQQLEQIGASIGSDVPFCVRGGCAVARGRGERLESVKHQMKPWVVLVRPNVYVSTADVYRSLTSADYSHEDDAPKMIRALQSNNLDQVIGQVSNQLSAQTFRLFPEVEQIQLRMQHLAEGPVFMSGSGPTLYTLVHNQAAAQRLYNACRGFTREVYLCRFRSM